jgi:hypothetical protein
MMRSQINPLAAEEDDFVVASSAELGDLAELVSYVLNLENTDKKLKNYSHDDFIRAVYLAATTRDRVTFASVAQGSDPVIKAFQEWKQKTGADSKPKPKKKGRRNSFLDMAGSLLGKSPRKKSAPTDSEVKASDAVLSASSEDAQSTDALNMKADDGLLSNIAKSMKSKDKNSYFNVIMSVHLLGGQTEAVTVMARTTSAEIQMAMASTLGIDIPIADECLGLFEYSKGMFSLLNEDECILDRVVSWADRQDHVNDTTVRLVYKRRCYRRHDKLEMAERASKDRLSGVHRMLVGSVSYHTTRGLYPISKGQAYAFAAAALYSKSGGNSSASAVKNIKAGIKRHQETILPPHLHNMPKKELKVAVKSIQNEYKKMSGLEMLEVEQVVCRNIRSWTDVYGASFFPVKCKRSCDISNAAIHFDVAILAVGYDQVTATVYKLDGDIKEAIVIPFHQLEDWDKHDLAVKEGAKLTLVGLTAPEHKAEGLFVESMMWKDIIRTLDMYKNMHQKFNMDGTMAGSEGNRRQVSRRESVKMSASSILDDMGDAFEDLEEDEDAVEGELEDSDEDEDEGEEGNDEIWDPHTTETGQTYYVGRKSRRSSWIVPSAQDMETMLAEETRDEAEGSDAGVGGETKNDTPDIEAVAAAQAASGWTKTKDQKGRTYFYEKGRGRRTSWVLPPGEVVTEVEDVVDELPLPEGWTETADDSGNTYYAHVDGTTAWERPE